jgi:hypothetical protein
MYQPKIKKDLSSSHHHALKKIAGARSNLPDDDAICGSPPPPGRARRGRRRRRAALQCRPLRARRNRGRQADRPRRPGALGDGAWVSEVRGLRVSRARLAPRASACRRLVPPPPSRLLLIWAAGVPTCPAPSPAAARPPSRRRLLVWAARAHAGPPARPPPPLPPSRRSHHHCPQRNSQGTITTYTELAPGDGCGAPRAVGVELAMPLADLPAPNTTNVQPAKGCDEDGAPACGVPYEFGEALFPVGNASLAGLTYMGEFSCFLDRSIEAECDETASRQATEPTHPPATHRSSTRLKIAGLAYPPDGARAAPRRMQRAPPRGTVPRSHARSRP